MPNTVMKIFFLLNVFFMVIIPVIHYCNMKSENAHYSGYFWESESLSISLPFFSIHISLLLLGINTE